MKKLILICLPLVLSLLQPLRSRAESEGAANYCGKTATFLAPASPSQRQYAPDRDIAVQHLALDITPDFKARAITGEAVLKFKPVVRAAREIRLDSVDLAIKSVSATEKIQAWQLTDSQVIVTFAEPIAPEKETTLTIQYSGEPVHGLYFRTPEMGYRQGDTHLFTQGESTYGRYWYPCLDTPNQLFTSEVTCRIPETMTAISNGRLVSSLKDPATGLVAIHWLQDKPHANYLMSLVAGNFRKLEDRHRDIPLGFYTPPSEFMYASNSFRDTRAMMKFFEEEIGVAYPWAKYDQVCVNDFVAGGMENTSATTLTDSTLFSAETETIRNSEGLVAHELAHQWFGDLVTCKDWSHLWLNEGFATYYESLWNAHHNGHDDMLYEMYQRARDITGIQNDTTPIVRRTYDQPDHMFGYLVYPKASWVLHMLRCQLGEEIFRRCVKTYLERHQFGNVVTEDFRKIVEELSGRSFDRFFDQWLYHGRHPDLEIGYSWDETSKLARLSIQQTHEVSANVLLFDFPLTVRFKGAFGTLDREIQVSKKQEDFYFPLESAPELVRVDPEYTLLARTRFSVPAPMLQAQLADEKDLLGRLLAVEQLGGKQDRDSISRLQQVLNSDPFYGARIEASKALRSSHNEEALAALLKSAAGQKDARVRRQVVDDIGSFYSEQACDFGWQTLEREKNPEILRTALRDLAGYSRPELDKILLKWLNSESFRNELADAAIGAMRSQDDPRYVEPLIEALTKREDAFTSHGLAQGLSAVAYLARNEEKKDGARAFLVGHVNSRRRAVQLAAITALGTLGDSKAIVVLEKFAHADKTLAQRSAAEGAIASLRAARKPVDDFKNLRQEVLDLQKVNREMRDKLNDLTKRFEAQCVAGPPVAAVPTRKVKTTSPKNK